MEVDNFKIDKFVKKSKDIMKELDSFKNFIVDHKNQMQIEKINYQNNQIYKDLDSKVKFLKDDVLKIRDIKKPTENEYILKVEEFKKKNLNLIESLPNELTKSSIINKIKNYCIKMKLNSMSLLNMINNSRFSINDEVDLNSIKINLVKFSILNENEAEFFTKTLFDYKNDKIKIDNFICLIDEQYKIKNQNKSKIINSTKQTKEENIENIYDNYKGESDEIDNIYNNDDDYEYIDFLNFF